MNPECLKLASSKLLLLMGKANKRQHNKAVAIKIIICLEGELQKISILD